MSDAAEPKKEQPAKTGASPEEIAAAMQGPAITVNRMVAFNAAGGMRIAFMEQFGTTSDMEFRTAVFISYSDAQSLRDLIDRQLERMRERTAGSDE